MVYNCGGYFKAVADSDSLATDSIQHLEIPATEGQVEGTTPAPAEQNANQQPLPSQPQNAEEPKE